MSCLQFLALAKNDEGHPDAPTGELLFWTSDPECAKRAGSASGVIRAEVVFDAHAWKTRRHHARTSFLLLPNGRWMEVSAHSAFIFCHGRYDTAEIQRQLEAD